MTLFEGDALRALVAAAGLRHQHAAQVLRVGDCKDQETEKGNSMAIEKVGKQRKVKTAKVRKRRHVF